MPTRLPNDLKHYRAKRGFTQRQVIQATGVRDYPWYETGQKLPTAEELERLCRHLHTTRFQLYDRKILDLIKEYGNEE